jgi:hypothetical protein
VHRKIRLNEHLLDQLTLRVPVTRETPHQMCDPPFVSFEQGRAGVIVARKAILTIAPITLFQTLSARQGDRDQ